MPRWPPWLRGKPKLKDGSIRDKHALQHRAARVAMQGVPLAAIIPTPNILPSRLRLPLSWLNHQCNACPVSRMAPNADKDIVTQCAHYAVSGAREGVVGVTGWAMLAVACQTDRGDGVLAEAL